MLRIVDIVNNRGQIIDGLKKERFKDAEEIIDKVLETDNLRKKTQTILDDTLNRSNTLSKQIGALMKEGKRDEAEAAKQESSELKAKSKDLQDELKKLEEELREILYTIPNAAHTTVPEGATPEDNELVTESGQLPQLAEDALPHWELIEKYD